MDGNWGGEQTSQGESAHTSKTRKLVRRLSDKLLSYLDPRREICIAPTISLLFLALTSLLGLTYARLGKSRDSAEQLEIASRLEREDLDRHRIILKLLSPSEAEFLEKTKQ
jgi:hypothetical protein